MKNFEKVLCDVRSCTICKADLPHQPRPVVQLHPAARILIAGQAPGRIVHETGVPFDDKSGERLRNWMGIDKSVFYNPKHIAILPMGFCYPGTGKSGDLPPRKECATKWRSSLLAELKNIELTLLVGQYAIDWHLGSNKQKTLTDTVKAWQTYWPSHLPLPHPSPRNNIWLKRNLWFEETVVPELKSVVQNLLIPK